MASYVKAHASRIHPKAIGSHRRAKIIQMLVRCQFRILTLLTHPNLILKKFKIRMAACLTKGLAIRHSQIKIRSNNFQENKRMERICLNSRS